MGIGRAIAKGLAAEGVKLAIAARRGNLLETLTDEIVAAGGAKPAIIEIDVMPEGAVSNLAQAARNALGHVDIREFRGRKSAGAPHRCAGSGMGRSDDAELHSRKATHARRVAGHDRAPLGPRHQYQREIGTGAHDCPHPAKAAVHAWSKGLSREVGKHGITVNCIPPGRIMSEQIRRKYSEEYRAEQSAKDIPVGRYGEPEELASLAVFLASPVARYITGAVLPVDGGLRRYAF